MALSNGRVARHQLEGDDTDRKNVGTGIHRAALDLFRGEISGRAEGDSGLGQLAGREDGLGDAEIHDLDRAVLEDSNIGRLDVPVDDPALMSKLEALANLDQNRDDGVFVGYHIGLEQLVEVVSGEKLLDDVRDVALDPEVKDESDVAVDEVADELGLLLEALSHLVVRRGAHLDRHFPFDKGIPALVNDAKAADSDLLDHLVLTDCRRLIHVAYFSGNILKTPQGSHALVPVSVSRVRCRPPMMDTGTETVSTGEASRYALGAVGQEEAEFFEMNLEIHSFHEHALRRSDPDRSKVQDRAQAGRRHLVTDFLRRCRRRRDDADVNRTLG